MKNAYTAMERPTNPPQSAAYTSLQRTIKHCKVHCKQANTVRNCLHVCVCPSVHPNVVNNFATALHIPTST